MRRSAAFDVVAQFEDALCEFAGATHCVTTDSCSNAIFLALMWRNRANWRDHTHPRTVVLPKHTYVGVVQAARNSGCPIRWSDDQWRGSYQIGGTNIIDSAKRFVRGMYQPRTLTCLSFQAGKILPIGRGGAILTNDLEAAQWLRRARLDGRTAGVDYQHNTYQREGWHCYLPPDAAARGLWLMTYIEDDDPCDWTAYPDLSEVTWT